MFGFPVADFSRMFFNYSYETVKMTDLNEALIDQSCLLRADGLLDHLVGGRSVAADADAGRGAAAQSVRLRLAAASGRAAARTISKVMPSFVHNTVDNPIFPNTGKRLTASIDLAVLGGNTQFYKPRLEGILFKRHLPRTSFGFRAQAEYIAPIGTRLRRHDRECQSAADLRAAVPRRRVQRARLRHPLDRARRCRGRSSCSAATRACCSTPST